ncbi:capsular biosynthesis protein [Castellaniella defragrans]|uniref:Capsular biosynthesis protein n=1 Tax=Castellaniella defragrans TaxID=75697 RepID=A0A7W9TP94_CASDE|nr:capsular biosynthesis protein [Castellaniella defragrans]KAB0612050.1 capsular biosynthesis protein [Castellaniella defragrans]MBB6083292.1 hypothetical protein [Castellaniella defragrans]
MNPRSVLACCLLAWLLPFVPAAQADEPPAAFTQASDGTDFYPFAIDEDRLAGPPAQTALNHPLGPQDRLFVKQGHFYAVGPDGVPDTGDDVRVRLFGINLSFAANFPSAAEAPALARRLRALGFNAVRLHHLDFHLNDPQASADAEPKGILTTGPYPSFDPRAVERLRTFIQALSKEGLYIDLNLRAGYRFRPAIDGLPPLDEGRSQLADVDTPIYVYEPRLIELQARYATTLIQSLGLAGNPALALVEINNESSLLSAWQSDIWHGNDWPRTIPQAYRGILRAQWEAWIGRRYGSLEAACRAWDRCGDPDVAALPAASLFGAHAASPSLMQRLGNRLERGLEQWLPRARGDSAEPDPDGRYAQDFLEFLTQMDRRYFERMRQTVQAAAQAPVPVTGTQMSYGGVLNFDSQAAMDYLDDHIYIGHPSYANGNSWQSEDWRIPDTSTAGAGIGNLLALSLRREAGKPFVISEYNHSFPAPRGGEIPPLMATVATLQDWDGLFFFDYADEPQPRRAPWYFSLSGNWGQYALMGQSARLFRQTLIEPLAGQAVLPLTHARRLALARRGTINSGTLAADLEARYGATPRLAWSRQIAEKILQDPAAGDAPQPALADAAADATPDGSVRHDAARERVILDTDQIWGVFGLLEPGESLSGRFFGLRLAGGPKNQPVQVLATPLDAAGLERSQHILLSLGSATRGTQPGSMPPRPTALIPYPGKSGWLTLEPGPLSKGPSGQLGTRAPAWLARSDVELGIPLPTGDIRIHPLDGTGARRAALPPEAYRADASGGFTWVRLQATARTASPWYEIEIAPGLRPAPASTRSPRPPAG